MITRKIEKEDLSRQRYHVISSENKNQLIVVFASSKEEAVRLWADKFEIDDADLGKAIVSPLSYKNRKMKVVKPNKLSKKTGANSGEPA